MLFFWILGRADKFSSRTSLISILIYSYTLYNRRISLQTGGEHEKFSEIQNSSFHSLTDFFTPISENSLSSTFIFNKENLWKTNIGISEMTKKKEPKIFFSSLHYRIAVFSKFWFDVWLSFIFCCLLLFYWAVADSVSSRASQIQRLIFLLLFRYARLPLLFKSKSWMKFELFYSLFCFW